MFIIFKKDEIDKLQAQLKSYQSLESELVDVHMKNSSAQERIGHLEHQLDELKRRHAREMRDLQEASASLQRQESSKCETLGAECVRLKAELGRVEAMHRQRHDALERELAEAKAAAATAVVNAASSAAEAAAKSQKLTDYEFMMSSGSRSSNDKFDAEIRLLNAQIASLVRSL